MEVRLSPVTARSALLSILLGAHPATSTARELVSGVGLVGISESTARVALSRMVAAGDLRKDGTTYSAADWLLDRQRRNDTSLAPATKPWHGDWEQYVVTASGRSPAERAELRKRLAELRLAELRDGLWLRPANLVRDWPADLDELGSRFTTRPEQDADELVATLWDRDAWAAYGHGLLRVLADAEVADDAPTRFAAIAAAVRHLHADPVLPPELTPGDWPGAGLRAAYDDFCRWITAMRAAAA